MTAGGAGPVRTEAAILWRQGEEWSVEEVELDPPRGREVLVRVVAAGLCHSDEHMLTGDMPAPLPLIGGHEGAGVVEAVGPDATFVRPGDHVAFSFVPACGACPSCAAGHSNLCDQGAVLMGGLQLDGTSRHHARGRDLFTMCLVGSFARHTVVHEWSVVPIPPEVPLTAACLVSCGVTTGWGSAVYAAEVRPGDHVAVLGIGGLGAAAVQGARQAGARTVLAVDPVPWKRLVALDLGATYTADDVPSARRAARKETWGRMCDKVICTMGTGSGALMADVMALAAKRGRVVVTNLHPWSEPANAIPLIDLTLMEKQVVGTIFGSANPRKDIPGLLELYSTGRLELDSLITRTYALDQVNEGYQDLRDGRNLRGVIVFD